MKKFRIIVDMTQEEQYLKGMAEQGWGLVNYTVSNVYTFETITPKAKKYKIDYRIFKKKNDYLEYLILFEDSGWKHISGKKESGFHFFLPKENQNQDLDIFSSVSSSNDRYKRLYSHATAFGLLMLTYFIILKPTFELPTWYLDPSLWEYKGIQLFGIIVVQTFFLVLKTLPQVFFLVGTFYYAFIVSKVKTIMKKNQIN